MIALTDRPWMTPAQYLEWEAQQPQKYEYLNGAAYAMAGGTIPHNKIAVNLIAALHAHLRDRPCFVLGSDAKVQIQQSQAYFYPDVVVTCDPRDRTAIEAICYPCLIVEVLSPGTETYDRSHKFQHYRRLPSLQQYVLISSDRVNIESFQLNAAAKWELTPYGAGDQVEFSGIECVLPIETLYEAVTLPPPSATSP